MDLIKQLKKVECQDIRIFGEGALYLYYRLPGMPVRLEYTAPMDCLRSIDGKRLQPEYVKIDYQYTSIKELPNVTFLHSIDIICHAIHTKDINTVVEYMLCNLESFDSSVIRKRYAHLYSPLAGTAGTNMGDVLCVMPIETYYKNVYKSNIATYMRDKSLSYADFCERTPRLCAELQCNESSLNSAIVDLL